MDDDLDDPSVIGFVEILNLELLRAIMISALILQM